MLSPSTINVQNARTMSPVVACVEGMTAQEAGRIEDAIGHFEHALTLAPSLIDIRLLLSFALGANGNHDRAREVLNGTPEVTSLPASDLRRVADAAVQIGATSVALTVVRKLLEHHADEADLHSTLGALLHRTGALEEAAHVLNRATLRWPSHVPTLMNGAQLLVADGHYAGGLRNFDRVLSVQPNHHKARWYRGLLHLTLGNFADGWADHEARRQLDVHTVNMPQGIRAWDGKNPRGKTLLLWGEQGLGDQIQGVRFAQHLSAMGARVVVRCAKPLCALFEGVPGVSKVVSETDPVPRCDAHVPMLSVPYLLKMSDDSKFNATAYLRSTPVQRTNARSMHQPRVGFAWAGSPGHTNDRHRSLPLSQLSSLLDMRAAEWCSLQVGPRSAELSQLQRRSAQGGSNVFDISPSLTSFVDTAQVMQALDYVVTVDTSVAHLAGALGVPTFVLIPFVPDWRWQLAREDSPWYSSVRLIRQPSAGDWGSVIDRVHRELAAGGQARAA